MTRLIGNAGGLSIQTWPDPIRMGDRIHIAFLAPMFTGPADDYEVSVHDARRRRVASLVRGPLRPANGVVCVEWDGRDATGALLPPGRYAIRVTRARSSYLLERTIAIEM